MKRFLIVFAAAAAAIAQDLPPTESEMRDAYMSKIREVGQRFVLWPRDIKWGMYGIREVRGWDVRFRNSKAENIGPFLLKAHYDGRARKRNVCADYRLVDVMPAGAPPHFTKRYVDVQPVSVHPCK